MRIGLFISETWGPGSAIEEVRRRALRTEELGFASGWVPYLPWSLDALTSVQAAGDATSVMYGGCAAMMSAACAGNAMGTSSPMGASAAFLRTSASASCA